MAWRIELLLGAVLYPSEPVLIADDGRNCLDVTSSASKLLGLSKDEIVGRRIDDFMEPKLRAQVAQLWQTLLEKGGQEGAFPLAASNGSVREIRFIAKNNVLPGRHVLFLLDKPNEQRLDGVGEAEGKLLFHGGRITRCWPSTRGEKLLAGIRERSAFTVTRARRLLASMPAVFTRAKMTFASGWMTS